MIRIVAAFVVILLLSLSFHLILGGDSQIRWQHSIININLKDLLIGVLLISNLMAIILLLRNKG